MTPIESPAPRLDYQEHRLDNGLRVVLHEDRRLPLVAINLWYHVGSKNEVPGRTGLAHLFEHMLFQGSLNVSGTDHFRYVQQVGGVANGSTWYDRTNYYETLPAHCLDLGLWLEADRMGFLLPALTREKLETQRQVVLNERRQRVDNQPYGRAVEELLRMAYPGRHPYGWPVIGTEEDIAAATFEDVEKFFRVYYAPSNAVLTLAGDFDPTRALGQIELYFGDLPAGPTPPPVAAAAPGRRLPAGAAERRVLPDRVGLERLYLAWVLPGLGSRDWHEAAFLLEALAGGKSSPLEQELVHRRRIAQDVSATLYPTELAATLLIAATAKPGITASEIEPVILDQLSRLREPGGGLAEADFERARNRLLVAGWESLERVDRKADLLSQGATYFGDPGRFLDDLAFYARIERPREATWSWLDAARRSCVIVVPQAAP
jgi:zinc protease